MSNLKYRNQKTRRETNFHLVVIAFVMSLIIGAICIGVKSLFETVHRELIPAFQQNRP